VRLFVALAIPAPIREALGSLIAQLRQIAMRESDRRPRWVRPENLHVTLKFIGEVRAAKLDGIREALAAVRSSSPVEMNFRGLGFFPNEKRPRVSWVGLGASANLATVAANIEHATATQGIAPESRAFTSHLTLARFEPPGIGAALRDAIQHNLHRDFGAVRTNEFHLIESKLKPTGAQYTTLHSFRFVPES
jgi:RNA 2',3'-cyclic 3'-phosphodiesterase